MRLELRLPQWGMGITEGTVVAWLKELGDDVAEGEGVVEIETAKATDVVVAPRAGVLIEVTAHAGTVVPVMGLLGVLESTDG